MHMTRIPRMTHSNFHVKMSCPPDRNCILCYRGHKSQGAKSVDYYSVSSDATQSHIALKVVVSGVLMMNTNDQGPDLTVEPHTTAASLNRWLQ